MAIITISRGSMSGGEALANCLAKTLGYPLLGRDVVVKAAEKLGVSEETLAQKISRGPGLWERMTSNRRIYVIGVQTALAEQAASGNMIYHGHAGHMLLRGIPNVLRIRLIAPLDMRVKAVMERQHLNREAAEEYIHNVDEDRVRWTKFIYGVDWSDPACYDVVVNLERMSVDSACFMLATLVGQPEFKTTEDGKRVIDDFLLRCRVRLALVTNPLTRDVDFEVTVKDGVVEIQGELPRAGMLTHTSERDEAEIQRTAQAVTGVKTVYLNVRKFDAYH